MKCEVLKLSRMMMMMPVLILPKYFPSAASNRHPAGNSDSNSRRGTAIEEGIIHIASVSVWLYEWSVQL